MESQDHIQKKWDKVWGDRLNELVIIGQSLDKEKIKGDLEVCLLNAEEIKFYKGGGKFLDSRPI